MPGHRRARPVGAEAERRQRNQVAHVAMVLRGAAQQLRRIEAAPTRLRAAACDLERLADALPATVRPEDGDG